MKVIKKGNHTGLAKVECENCYCVFLFSKKEGFVWLNEITIQVNCPDCNYENSFNAQFLRFSEPMPKGYKEIKVV